MAQLDAGIILGGRPAQIESPVNALAKALQVQGMQQQNQLGQMKMDQARSAGVRQNKLAELLRAGADEEGLRREGFIDEASQIGKDRSAATTSAAQAEKLKLQTAMEKLSAVGQIMAGVKDQASYDQARAQAQAMGLDVSQSPPQYDPAMVEQKRQQALTMEQQLAQVWKQKGFDLDQQKFGEVQRNNQAQNAISRGQLGVSQGNLALSRERLSLDKQQGPAGKPPAGYRWTPDGALEPIPGGPGAQRAAEVGFKQGERNDAKDAKRSAISAQIAVVDKALGHPGRATSTGLSGTIDPRNYIPGTDAADFRAVLDQIGGTAFLQAFESLKGGGQITEVEGKKATDAIARLSRAQSDKEFQQSLKDLREVMVKGQQRLGSEGGTPAASGGDIDSLLEKYK